MNRTARHRHQAPRATDWSELCARLRELPTAARLSTLADTVARIALGGTPMNARRHSAAEAVRAVMVARNLRRVAPNVDAVQTTPVYVDGDHAPRTVVHVHLADVLRLPLGVDAATHQAAYDVLRRAYPRAQWTSSEYRYDVRPGRLSRVAPELPGDLR